MKKKNIRGPGWHRGGGGLGKTWGEATNGGWVGKTGGGETDVYSFDNSRKSKKEKLF